MGHLREDQFAAQCASDQLVGLDENAVFNAAAN